MRRDTVKGGIGSAIAARLKQSQLTRRQLALAAAIDDRQMARVLAGRSGLSIESLSRIASALGCHPADILREALPARVGRGASLHDKDAA